MYWLIRSFLLIATLLCFTISIYQAIYLRPIYVEKARSLTRETSTRDFWLSLIILSLVWLFAYYFSPQHFWYSIVISAPSVLVAAIDSETHFLPNRLIIFVWIAAVLEALAAGFETGINRPILAIAAGFLGGAIFLVFALVGVGLGIGDVKLIPPILAVAVLSHTWLGYIVALCVLPGFYAFLMILRSASLKTRIAYGPWIIVALPISMLLGM